MQVYGVIFLKFFYSECAWGASARMQCLKRTTQNANKNNITVSTKKNGTEKISKGVKNRYLTDVLCSAPIIIPLNQVYHVKFVEKVTLPHSTGIMLCRQSMTRCATYYPTTVSKYCMKRSTTACWSAATATEKSMPIEVRFTRASLRLFLVSLYFCVSNPYQRCQRCSDARKTAASDRVHT